MELLTERVTIATQAAVVKNLTDALECANDDLIRRVEEYQRQRSNLFVQRLWAAGWSLCHSCRTEIEVHRFIPSFRQGKIVFLCPNCRTDARPLILHDGRDAYNPIKGPLVLLGPTTKMELTSPSRTVCPTIAEAQKMLSLPPEILLDDGGVFAVNGESSMNNDVSLLLFGAE